MEGTLKEETDVPTWLHSALFPCHSWEEEEEGKGKLVSSSQVAWEYRVCWSMNSCKEGALEIL